MRKNNKGFVITEVLILSTVILGILIFMYVQFKNINRSYQYSFRYDTVQDLYLTNNILNFINESSYDKLVARLETEESGFIDITTCDVELFSTCTFYESLIEKSEVNKIIFTKENLTNLNKNNLSSDIVDYINQLKVTNTKNDYRLIVKYNDNTFASLRFNKGESYVQNGLIAFLDGTNNTGFGHSNDTQTWVDLSGHGNDAVLYNNPTWSNNSLTFDGQTNYGLLTNTANIEFQNGFTLETRVNILSFVGTNLSGHIEYFGNWENAGGGFIFDKTYKHRTSFKNISIAQSTVINNLNEYYTVAATYDNTTLNWYINGSLVATVESNAGTLSSSAIPFGLGGNPNANGMGDYANVEFQNVLIYDRALTEQEVQRNYQADIARY